MKRIGTLLIFSFSILFLYGQTPVPYLKKNGKYIFVDSANMKQVFQGEFDDALQYSAGLAAVKKDFMWGYIDAKGNTITGYKLNAVSAFVNGFARIKINNQVCYLDAKGNIIGNNNYQGGEFFSEGMAAVKKNGKWGFINQKGEEVIKADFSAAESFSEGLAMVSDGNGWGFIDKTGKKVIDMQYSLGFSFSEGVAAVMKNNKMGYINKSGKTAIPFEFDMCTSFSSELALVVMGDKKSFIDKSGKQAIQKAMAGYTNAKPFSEGRARVFKNGFWGFIDNTGKEVVAPKYEEADAFQSGWTWVKTAEGYLLIDKNGKEQFAPSPYDDRHITKNGLTKVFRPEGNFGYIDTQGRKYWE